MSGGERFAPPRVALLGAVSDAFVGALRADRGRALDPERARAQHAGYARALRDAGVAVESLPVPADCPDAVFVEDVALVLSADTAQLTRPGAESRRPEVAPAGEALAARVRVTAWPGPGTLDGGDVMRAGDVLYVGRSTRTDAAGVESLRAAAAGHGLCVVEVPVEGGLHLKSVVTLLAPGRLVALRGALDPAPFRERGLQVLLTDEPAGANVLALGRVVLVSSAAPRLAERLAREPDLEPRPVEVDELHAADGALTCLSLRIPPPGCWCA